MRAMVEAGFAFWGVFAGFALLVAAYMAWMWWVERDGGER